MVKHLIPDFDKKLIPTKKQLQILENVRKCQKIIEYLELKTHGVTTRNFSGYIRNYFVKLDIKDPDKYLQDPRRMENNKSLDYLDSIENNVLKFNKLLHDKSGSYRKSNLTAVRKLLEHNKIDLGNSFWEDVRKNGKKAIRITEIETPTKEQLRNILSRADAEGKAIFLMQMTSCSRISEILTLTFDRLHLDQNPPAIRITDENSKNGKPITKFITPEAKYWLEQYLKEYDTILKTRINRARDKITKEEYKNKVFPMGSSNASVKWNNLLKKEVLYKLDPISKHPTMGTHSLRRYFEDNIGNRKLSRYMANKLTKSEEPYQFKTEHKLEEEYLKYMSNLNVFEEPIENNPAYIYHQEKIENIEEENNILKEEMKLMKFRQDYLKHQTDIFEEILKKERLDLIDPIGSFELSKEAGQYEKREREKLIQKRKIEIIKNIRNNPDYKDIDIEYKNDIPRYVNKGEPIKGIELLYKEIKKRTKNPDELTSLIEDMHDEKKIIAALEAILVLVKRDMEKEIKTNL